MKYLGSEGFLKELLRASRGHKVGIFTHARADPDGYGSAYALYSLLLGSGVSLVRAYLDDMNSLSKGMCSYFPMSLPEEDFIPDVAVVVDTCGLKQAHRGDEFSGRDIFVIDHHRCRGSSTTGFGMIVPEASSTSELVLALLASSSFPAPPQVYTALLTGLFFDTGNLKYGGKDSLISACRMLEAGADHGLATSLATREQSLSLRTAKLKAAQRAEIVRIGDLLVAFSVVGSFEAESAQGLVELGADVSFVAANRKGGSRVSGRAGERAIKEGIDLTDLLGNLGGGHKGAAGAFFELDAEGAIAEVRRLALSYLGSPRAGRSGMPF